MPVYEYIAVNSKGKKVKGTLEVNSLEELEMRLRDRRLHLLKHKEKSRKRSREITIGRKRLKDEEIARLFAIVGYITNTGLSIINSLEDAKRATNNKRLIRIIDELILSIQRGSTFTDALKSQSEYFPKFIIESVALGEKAGELPKVLLAISEQLEKNKEIKAKIKNASIYPTFVLSFIVLLVYVVITFVFPRIVKSIHDVLAGRDYPPYTKFIMGILNKVEIVAPYVPYVIGLFVFILIIKNRVGPIKLFFDKLVLKVPYLNKIILYRELINMLQVLIIGIQSGMGFVNSLEMAEGSLQNLILKRKISEVRTNISLGEGISKSFKEADLDVFIDSMITAGERSGTLDESLSNALDVYTKEVDVRIKEFFSWLEPIIILVLGMIVLSVLLCSLVPMWESMSYIGKM